MLFVVLAGCSSPESSPTYHRDIRPLLRSRCQACHSEGAIAPFALESFAQAKTHALASLDAMEARRMPPWHASDAHRNYRYDPTLAPEQLSAFEAWITAGMPEGDPAEPGPSLPSVQQTLSRVDIELSMAEPYVLSKAGDDYRCFVLDWPAESTAYVTGFNAQPDQRSVVHHIGVFLVSPDNPLGEAVFQKLEELEAQDPAPGYRCFGGPAGDSELPIPAQQLGQWVPGQGGGDFPAGTGIEVLAGSKVVFQLHYNMASAMPTSDRSSLQFRVDKSVERKAGFAPWLNAGWVFGGMPIAAGAPDVSYEHAGDPIAFFEEFVPGADLTAGFDIHGAMLHMHRLGKSAAVSLDRGDGAPELLLELPRYDFDWQRMYYFQDRLRFDAGQTLRVRCNYDNSKLNPAVGEVPKEVNWGEGTGDEMCVANLYVSEP
jgi:hypothetical protein